MKSNSDSFQVHFLRFISNRQLGTTNTDSSQMFAALHYIATDLACVAGINARYM